MKPESDKGNPPWYSELCITRKQEPFVILSELPAEKKKLVWAHIRTNYPEIADLLKSDELRQFKSRLEALFGPVGIGVDLKDIGGSLYGVRRKTQRDN
ncbi:hypothetical protein [Vibrio spartinae]|uniref:Uncharacterized protein n=1 Tax=Vibrio spartinae TaxID=1918945 RepID=A0A1N6M5I0_9VIBR|nr:hypothetical protein [Vibrio spartinae]SIO94684.1 hypothetical protein VSP9026_02413 [Vibrio spartinae]